MATIAPPSSPLMTIPPAETPDVPAPLLTDDIADPPVPAGLVQAATTVPELPDALVPLAHGFCQYVQAQLGTQLTDAGIKMARSMDTTITAMADYTKGVLATNEHAHYAFADALAKITATHTPYEMTLQVSTPAGVPLTLTIRQQTPVALLDELTRLEAWLQANGYTAGEAVPR